MPISPSPPSGRNFMGASSINPPGNGSVTAVALGSSHALVSGAEDRPDPGARSSRMGCVEIECSRPGNGLFSV